MKMLNLKDNLNIVEVENSPLTEIEIEVNKEVMLFSLKEVYNYLSNIIEPAVRTGKKNICVNIRIAKGVSKQEGSNIFFTISAIMVDHIITSVKKTDEHVFRARSEITEAVTMHSHSLTKLVNYESIIDNLQINLYRKNKLVFSLVE